MEPISASDQRWMKRALELARRGEALAHPNPMVGAVVVCDGRVVGEGFHTYDGVRHAEVIALEQARNHAAGATLYVNFEPCCHNGRTGPCTQAIADARIRRVVAAMQDPNPLVAGKSFRWLQRRGIEVTAGAEAADARRLNEAFGRWVGSRRPLVTLKAAATLDGQLAPANAGQRWITSDASRQRGQRLRHAADAVLTGIGTVLADDPLLTDRTGLPRRRPLLRVVVDSRLRLPPASRLVRSAAGDVVVYTLRSPRSPAARRLAQRGVRVVRVRARTGKPDLVAVLEELGRAEILSVLAEAGPGLNGALLERKLADKVFLFYAPKILGRATVPLARAVAPAARPLAAVTAVRLHRFGPDVALEGYLRDVYRDH
ncbi:MAG TPA: bifunctional diaminohydroxyphosphoribosylaminopyrimidine deaminase/5-amino-6-(5-phosphoribosylamino)uracil reductase RibD [Candidatus Acidoferrales bacterium]|nr:bifunctional diaminohydroxyphosphoribosylaminopyrimidine deaminase/5-amino-6-(5-phosphoribosylamino)uracil reductase RibD [Candidatus Acidoferrales bacterium]